MQHFHPPHDGDASWFQLDDDLADADDEEEEEEEEEDVTPPLEEHHSSPDDDDVAEEEDAAENRSNEDCHCNIHVEEVVVVVDASLRRMEVPMIRSSTKMTMMDDGGDDGDHSIANDDWEEVEAEEDIPNPHPHLPHQLLPDVEDGDCNDDDDDDGGQQQHHRHDASVDLQ